jgi:hypothetical protein
MAGGTMSDLVMVLDDLDGPVLPLGDLVAVPWMKRKPIQGMAAPVTGRRGEVDHPIRRSPVLARRSPVPGFGAARLRRSRGVRFADEIAGRGLRAGLGGALEQKLELVDSRVLLSQLGLEVGNLDGLMVVETKEFRELRLEGGVLKLLVMGSGLGGGDGKCQGGNVPPGTAGDAERAWFEMSPA